MPRTAAHLQATRWKPGVSPNPAGRPKGSRSKLKEKFLELLNADFERHGEATIRKVREQNPSIYLRIVSSLLPRQQEKMESPFVDLTDDELNALEEHLAASRARLVREIDQHNGATPPNPNPEQPELVLIQEFPT